MILKVFSRNLTFLLYCWKSPFLLKHFSKISIIQAFFQILPEEFSWHKKFKKFYLINFLRTPSLIFSIQLHRFFITIEQQNSSMHSISNFQCHGELRYAGWRLGAVLLLASADVASLPIPALLGCGRVGWAAHVAGALAGPLLGLAVFPNQSKKDARGRRFVRFVRLLSAISVMLLVVGAILGNIYLIALPQLRKPSWQRIELLVKLCRRSFLIVKIREAAESVFE